MTPAQLARRRLAQPGPHRFAAAAALLQLPKGESMSDDKLTAALEIYREYHGPPSSEAAASIARLVAESRNFDLVQWRGIVKDLVVRGRKGRADLGAASYRRAARRKTPAPTPKPRPNNAAYQKLLAESRAAENERAQRLAELLGRGG